jgi:tetratricopeptide (TPR) repeat protein
MEMYLRRGTLFLKNNSFDAAIADANTVLDILSNVERANPDTFVGNTVDFERAAPNTVVNIGPAIGRAYQFRGVFYHKKGDIERALADDENSIKLDPRTSAAYYDRGTISQERGEFAQAADDFARFSEIDPKSAPVRFRIGVVDWELGKFGDALQDFSDTTIEPDKDLAVDYALWRWIAAAKAGKGETFNPSGKQIANDGSSKSILDLYEGKGSIEALMKSSKEAASKGGVCKANFFGGIWQEIHADKSTAIAMLGAAVSDCPSDYIERSAASAELKRLQ